MLKERPSEALRVTWAAYEPCSMHSPREGCRDAPCGAITLQSKRATVLPHLSFLQKMVLMKSSRWACTERKLLLLPSSGSHTLLISFLHALIFAKPFPLSGSREAAAPSPDGHLLCALAHWLAEPLNSMLIKLDPNTRLGKWDAGCPLLLWQPCEPNMGWVSCRLDELSWAGSTDAAAGSWCSSKRGSVEGNEWKRSASLDAVQGIIII